MLRTNLATRPFYNERAVHLVLWSLAAAAVLLLLVGWIALSDLLQERETLIAASESNEKRTQEILVRTAILERGAEAAEFYRLSAASREVNLLIDQRVFSWTGFLNQIEATLPKDIMLTSVRPDVIDGAVGAQMSIVSQSVDAIDEFIERLEETGGFTDVLSSFPYDFQTLGRPYGFSFLGILCDRLLEFSCISCGSYAIFSGKPTQFCF